MSVSPKTVRRICFYVVGISTAGGAAYLLDRFDVDRIPPGYSVLEPEVPPGSSALVDRRFSRSGPLRMGQLVSFRVETPSGPAKRYGRVAALEGTRLEDGPELLLDGVLSGCPPPEAVDLPATIREGEFLVVTNVAIGAAEQDTRATLLVPEDDVLARVLLPLSQP